MKIGDHCIRTWSRTQHLVAASPAEAELYASVRAACEALGVQTQLKDLGQDMDAKVHIDASAAKSIIEREGHAKIRHIDTHVLWIQEQEAHRTLPLCKILGSMNPADLMTRQDINNNMEALRINYRGCRAGLAPELHHRRFASETCATGFGAGRRVKHRSEGQTHPGEKNKGMKDKRRLQEQFAVRVHARSRRKLFTPLDAKAGDNIQDADFGGLRVARVFYEGGTPFRVEDA